MAEIDKGLPNVRRTVTLPSEQEQAEVATEIKDSIPSPESTEMIENEDGSVDINFEPGGVSPEGGDDHYGNLADLLTDSILDPIGSELFANYTDYKASRREWERSYTQGLELLGFQFEMRTRPFQGASGATHPVLAEAVTQIGRAHV